MKKRCNKSKSNPKHDVKQAKIVLNDSKTKTKHQLRKRLLKRVFIYAVVIKFLKSYQQGQTILLKWVEKYHKFRRECDVSVSYLWSEAEVLQLSLVEQTGQLLLSDQPICSSLRFSELWTFFTASELPGSSWRLQCG